MNKLVYFFSGFLFAIGLGLSGMTNPNKVRAFLDIFSDWNPALVFVMIGAIAVHSLAYIYIRKMNSPIFGASFSVPQNRQIDRKMLGGNAIFGVGWGLGGYCPGPAIASLGILTQPVIVFFISMLSGIFIFHGIYKKLKSDP